MAVAKAITNAEAYADYLEEVGHLRAIRGQLEGKIDEAQSVLEAQRAKERAIKAETWNADTREELRRIRSQIGWATAVIKTESVRVKQLSQQIREAESDGE